MSDYAAELLDALRAAGLEPVKGVDLVPDGRLVRYRGAGDKPGALNCWVVFHGGEYPAAAFGSWRTREQHTWQPAREAARHLSAAEVAARRRQAAIMDAARRAEQVKVQAEARERAASLWGRGRPATGAHGYLQRKGVRAYGLRRLGPSLLVPLRDASGQMHSLQFIQEDGTKRFLTGGRIQGCYFPIGRPSGLLLVCEGYATGATLHMATGHAVAMAFTAGNLLPVATALRAKFPSLRIVVCADNDRFTPGNPGVTAATAAARAVRGLVVVPQFPESTE